MWCVNQKKNPHKDVNATVSLWDNDTDYGFHQMKKRLLWRFHFHCDWSEFQLSVWGKVCCVCGAVIIQRNAWEQVGVSPVSSPGTVLHLARYSRSIVQRVPHFRREKKAIIQCSFIMQHGSKLDLIPEFDLCRHDLNANVEKDQIECIITYSAEEAKQSSLYSARRTLNILLCIVMICWLILLLLMWTHRCEET